MSKVRALRCRSTDWPARISWGSQRHTFWSTGHLGKDFSARANPWINTAIFVGPAYVGAWSELLFQPLSGVALPTALPLAMSAYIGMSFILQWKIRYGGCEVVTLPILLSKRRYTTYCLPLVAVDAAEKVVVERLLAPMRLQEATETNSDDEVSRNTAG